MRHTNEGVRKGKPILFVETTTGCFIPISHQLNPDGYFRKNVGGRNEMFHRTIWRLNGGEIPEGHEVDHLCGCRACCNIKHLRVIPRAEHLDKHNRARYRPRKEAAKLYWQSTGCTGTALAAEFGVCFSIGCRWIREWKQAA